MLVGKKSHAVHVGWSMTIENVRRALTITITTCMPWLSASGGEVWDKNLLVPSLSFWARGRVVNTDASNANLQCRCNSSPNACKTLALLIVN